MRVINFVRGCFRDIVRALSPLKQRLRIRWIRATHVPKYGSRTPEEHNIIRRLVRTNPKKCTHLKGAGGIRSQLKDYNVSDHTFIDGTRRIHCLSCGSKWFKGQPGWEEALKMSEQSTNHRSRSQVPLGVNIRNGVTYVNDTPLEDARKDPSFINKW